MKTTPKTSNLFHSKLTAGAFAALAPALISLTFSSTAQAATLTWNGGNPGHPAWYANANWDGSAPTDGDSLVFAGNLVTTHYAYAGSDGDGDLQVAGITFADDAGAFVINVTGGGIIKLQGDITNDDADLQTLNFNFQLNGGNRTVNTSAGDIAIGGIISQDVAGLSLTKAGSHTLTLSGANTHTSTEIGATNGVTAGTVSIRNNAALGTGNLDYGAGGTLQLGVDGLAVANGIFVGNRIDTAARTIQLDLAGSNTGELTGNIDIRVDQVGEFVADVGTDDTLTFSGNLVTGAGGNAGLTKAGAGTLVLEGTNTYVGATTVNDGTLIVDGNSSGVAGNVTIASGATLGGSGTIGGATTIQSGATLAAGNSPGVLTFNDNLTLSAGSDTVMEITGTTRDSQYDGIDVGGLLTYGGALTITSTAEIADGTYDLFGINGTEGGDFATVVLSGLAYSDDVFSLSSDMWTAIVGSKTYSFSQITGDLTVVPEPETFALLGGLLALGYVMVRRRR
jgi:autotransporter-associated beta strand protein